MEATQSQRRSEQTGAGLGASFCPGCGSEKHAPRCEVCGSAREVAGFRILKVLHESDHARVYLAEDARGGRVALKELIFARAPDAQTIDAFEREAALLRQTSHPAIPRFVASFREGDGPSTRLYLAQEFVEGTTLAAAMESRRYDAREAASICGSLLRILAYLHGLAPPLVHRDIKPSNIILRPDGSLALVDFGCAREVAPRGTHRATVVGTFGYMPPEALGGTLDRTCDLYGLGATLVNLMTRRPPEELLWEKDEAQLVGELNVSPAFGAFIARLVARGRSQRFSDASAALRAFESLGRMEREAPPAPLAPPMGRPRPSVRYGLTGWRRRHPRRRRRVVGFLAVAAVVWFAVSSARRARPRPAVRPPIERIAAPDSERRGAPLGSLDIGLTGQGPIEIDGAPAGEGSRTLAITRTGGALRVGSAGRELAFEYRVSGGELWLRAPDAKGKVLIDGKPLGSGASFRVPEQAITIRNTSLLGKKRLPITLRFQPAPESDR